MKTLLLLFVFTPFFLVSQTYVDSVYEFDVGDEFHYEKRHSNSGSTQTTRTIKRIIGKNYTLGKVNYQIHSYGIILTPFNPDRRFSNIINETYDTTSLFDTLPPCFVAFCSYDTIKIDPIYGLSYEYDTSEWHYCLSERHSKHLGRTYYYECWPDAINSRSQYESLEFFKRDSGRKTWGTPYTFTSSLEENFNLTFSIYPNPSSNSIFIKRDNLNPTNYNLTNSLGQVIQSGILINNQIDCSHLTKGIYFLRLTDQDNNTGIQRVVIAK